MGWWGVATVLTGVDKNPCAKGGGGGGCEVDRGVAGHVASRLLHTL